ncbi:MAG: ferrochelatase [Acidimicrobiales bacterium]
MTQSLVGFDAILWLSFGGPEGPDDVMPFLRNVTRGRNVPDARLALVAEQYALFGGVSNINSQNREAIELVSETLRERGIDLPIYFGNRNWSPYVADTVSELIRDGHRRVLVFATSAYGSYSACRQYREDMALATATNHAEGTLELVKLRHFYNHPLFIECLMDGISEVVEEGFDPTGAHTAIVATAHSIPLGMGGRDRYKSQLATVREALARELGKRFGTEIAIEMAFQSRSGPPTQPWLEPDISIKLDALHEQGIREVLVVPIGFLSDHQEVRYDLDTLAHQHANEQGITFHRSATVARSPRFPELVADLICEELSETSFASIDGVVSGRPCARDCCQGTDAHS